MLLLTLLLLLGPRYSAILRMAFRCWSYPAVAGIPGIPRLAGRLWFRRLSFLCGPSCVLLEFPALAGVNAIADLRPSVLLRRSCCVCRRSCCCWYLLLQTPMLWLSSLRSLAFLLAFLSQRLDKHKKSWPKNREKYQEILRHFFKLLSNFDITL